RTRLAPCSQGIAARTPATSRIIYRCRYSHHGRNEQDSAESTAFLAAEVAQRTRVRYPVAITALPTQPHSAQRDDRLGMTRNGVARTELGLAGAPAAGTAARAGGDPGQRRLPRHLRHVRAARLGRLGGRRQRRSLPAHGRDRRTLRPPRADAPRRPARG